MNDESEAKQLITTRGSASGLEWSPDGSKLAFVSNRGDHGFIGVYDFQSKELKYISPSVDHDNGPIWSPDGSRIGYVRIPNERKSLIFEPHRSGLPWSIRIADVATGESTELWRADEGNGSVFRQIDATNQIFWGNDGYIVFPWEKFGWTNLFSISTKTKEVKRLTTGEFEVQFVAISPTGDDIFYSSNQNDIDRQHIWKSPIKGGNPTQITSGEGVEWAPVPMPNGSLASLSSNPISPAKAVMWKGSKPTPLIAKSVPENYPTKHLVKPEQIVYNSSDGISIHGQLFKGTSKNHDSAR